MEGQINLETERTILRNLTTEDAEEFYKLNLDREVVKYTGDNSFETLESSRTFLANYDQYKKYGVGRLAVIGKQTREFIGWCGLKYSIEKDEYDIGFRFFRKHWNKGFATETAQKCIEYGFQVLNIQCIVGRSMSENISSIKVLEKLGMTFKEKFDFDGHEGVIYHLTNSNK